MPTTPPITEADAIAAIAAYMDATEVVFGSSRARITWTQLDARENIAAGSHVAFDAADPYHFRDVGPFRFFAPKWDNGLRLSQISATDMVRGFDHDTNCCGGAIRTIGGFERRRITIELQGRIVYVEDQRDRTDVDILNDQIDAFFAAEADITWHDWDAKLTPFVKHGAQERQIGRYLFRARAHGEVAGEGRQRFGYVDLNGVSIRELAAAFHPRQRLSAATGYIRQVEGSKVRCLLMGVGPTGFVLVEEVRTEG